MEGAIRTKVLNEGNHLHGKYSSRESAAYGKVSKGLKSFSHEIGPKGGISPAQPRAHSYSDLEVMIHCLRRKSIVLSNLISVLRLLEVHPIIRYLVNC